MRRHLSHLRSFWFKGGIIWSWKCCISLSLCVSLPLGRVSRGMWPEQASVKMNECLMEIKLWVLFSAVMWHRQFLLNAGAQLRRTPDTSSSDNKQGATAAALKSLENGWRSTAGDLELLLRRLAAYFFSLFFVSSGWHFHNSLWTTCSALLSCLL